MNEKGTRGNEKGTSGSKKGTSLEKKGPYADEKAHVGTRRGEIGSERNTLVWNEIISVKTLNIVFFKKRYLGKRAHLYIGKNLGAIAFFTHEGETISKPLLTFFRKN